VKRHPLVAYVVLVLASVAVAALLLVAFPGRLPTAPVLLLASWLPNLVGVAVTAAADGSPGVRALLARAIRWRFGARWYAVAVLLPLTASVLAFSLGGLTGAAPALLAEPNVLIPLVLFNVLAGPLGEELGWRGTALPRLQARWGALTASVLLGLIWWTFHTPGFVLGLFSPGFTPIAALVGSVALSILITWMFNHTRGSLIPGALMHLSINLSTSVFGVAESPLLYASTVAVLAAAALVVVVFGLQASSANTGNAWSIMSSVAVKDSRK
jgi:uncharacterized protein